MSGFTKEQIEDLLVNVLDTPVMKDWKGSKIQFCCTIHGEKNPSCGIDIDYCPDGEPNLHGQVFNCFLVVRVVQYLGLYIVHYLTDLSL